MKNTPTEISLNDYTYNLPEEKIAKEPLKERSDSKLLTYKNGILGHDVFNNIAEHIPSGACLIFNNTRVIPARLFFVKDTGALIEIFLLEPLAPTNEVASAMLVKNTCVWKCMIGNLKKWKEDQALRLELHDGQQLKVKITDRQQQLVEFTWDSNEVFVHVLEAAGKIPLPPYINREVTFEDQERYQTVYSKFEGAVAAPTAGLHFDDKTLESLSKKKVDFDYLTLHVSAGTFQPIKVDNVLEHAMHSEQVVVTLENINTLLSKNFIVSVGTTSMRTLESLYWYGVKLINGETEFFINKLYPYDHEAGVLPSKSDALEAVKRYLIEKSLTQITGQTEIFIFPGYKFRICNGLITNFHLPGSTLILLVAAFIGEDWREVYKKAIANDYRFLSYGDSSLLLPS
ncbi:S-adenosylmethionine:tRNA ribosyltransferase-isomerase [Fulvivirga lutimaris]|uniref:S-adenosylmethionine:tRNA ribosyltransferase-isomerase n=1 Tax=Fulvivirga lutimaris TaxID=1819566 RepID=UPI0012BC85EC|nr:S-adenosylmethionine:tRNA ribosyltransferase-isomerase [Fulvivirga lutimaris]MTI40673.1 S-adenosylmethionine:tRNA ribosyltransferase-isomerase [Fulvivirga lutimaris]